MKSPAPRTHQIYKWTRRLAWQDMRAYTVSRVLSQPWILKWCRHREKPNRSPSSIGNFSRKEISFPILQEGYIKHSLHRHSGILYLSPVPEHSGTGLDPLIPVPDWFRHRHFCSFRYRTDWMRDSPTFRHLKKGRHPACQSKKEKPMRIASFWNGLHTHPPPPPGCYYKQASMYHTKNRKTYGDKRWLPIWLC